jgi:hypothetical protein
MLREGELFREGPADEGLRRGFNNVVLSTEFQQHSSNYEVEKKSSIFQ